MQIRALRRFDELQEANRLEAVVWGASDPTPVSLLTVFAHHGGLILGAFEGERLIGLSVGFPGRDTHIFYLHSHLLAVHPEFRGRRIGEALKREQQQWARDQGYPYVGWTYDPLVAPNAWFNLAVLGARVADIRENVYGPLADAINGEFPTHRLWVVWDTQPTEASAAVGGESRRLPIPEDIVALRATNPKAALHLTEQWFLHAQSLWQDGWRIAGVERDASGLSYRWIVDGGGVGHEPSH